MYLSTLQVRHLRCLADVRLNADPHRNLIVGDNGSGKTSCLEAIYLLSRGHSFRLGADRQLISRGQDICTVRASLMIDEIRWQVAIQKNREGSRVRINQSRGSRLSELARLCPALVLDPGQHRLLEDGPQLRRRFLDWLVFHVEPGYFQQWQRFNRVLRQRNALLRQGAHAAINTWNSEFVEAALAVSAARQNGLAALQSQLDSLLPTIVGDDRELSLHYRTGWPKDRDLADLLNEHADKERARGFSLYGPHRGELRCLSEQQLARDTLSRGQQKMFIAALVLAQARVYAGKRSGWPVLLVDDVASELGEAAQERIFSVLAAYPGQCFVTGLDQMAIPREWRQSAKMFHVKHGQVDGDAR